MSTTSTRSLAPVQAKTLSFLRNFIEDKGYAPTLKEICLHIGAKSPSTAHFHLSRLEEKGFLLRDDDGSFQVTAAPSKSEQNEGNMSVPLLGLIAAGSPIEAIENEQVKVEVPPQFIQSKSEIYCLQVTGDSMIDAHIMDGDIIIVKRQNTAENGEIVVALLEDNTATLKTFRRLKGGKIMLVPHNPSHQPITVDKVDIQGRYIGLIRENF